MSTQWTFVQGARVYRWLLVSTPHTFKPAFMPVRMLEALSLTSSSTPASTHLLSSKPSLSNLHSN